MRSGSSRPWRLMTLIDEYPVQNRLIMKAGLSQMGYTVASATRYALAEGRAMIPRIWHTGGIKLRCEAANLRSNRCGGDAGVDVAHASVVRPRGTRCQLCGCRARCCAVRKSVSRYAERGLVGASQNDVQCAALCVSDRCITEPRMERFAATAGTRSNTGSAVLIEPKGAIPEREMLFSAA